MWGRLVYSAGLAALILTGFMLLLRGAELRYSLWLGLALLGWLFVGLLWHKVRWIAAVVVVLLAGSFWLFFRPVCVPLTPEQVASVTPAIEQRMDRSGYMDVFQQLPDGSWQQCKMAISRWFFF